MLLLENVLGMNISALLTGLGIGGISIALASQALLADAMNSLVLLFDKPFEVGDYITIPGTDLSGSIEYIGFRTSKIRSPKGPTIIVTNTELAKSKIENWEGIKRIRDRIFLEISVDNKKELVQKMEEHIRDAVREIPVTINEVNLMRTNGELNSMVWEIRYTLEKRKHENEQKFGVELQRKILSRMNICIFCKLQEENVVFPYHVYKNI